MVVCGRDAENNSQVFETKTQLKEIKQGHLSVTKYYADLKKLWQEIKLYEEIDSLCGDCSVKYKKKKQKEQVYEFLAELNSDLDEVKGRIISRSPFPSTEEAFADIRREESRRRIMLQKGDFQQSEKSSFLIKTETAESLPTALMVNRTKFNNDSKGVRRSERHGVTIVRNLVTPRLVVGKFMESLLIGLQRNRVTGGISKATTEATVEGAGDSRTHEETGDTRLIKHRGRRLAVLGFTMTFIFLMHV
ncbi:hypothetical protein LIER_16953 [Lithospermum erythrorhizon]|uniref:Retrotransposon gag domain-containing protein n=1 Tax=Lithospermum erythrorhizon TaxID=34254 RepID=A0AAV3Q8K8_LITER